MLWYILTLLLDSIYLLHLHFKKSKNLGKNVLYLLPEIIVNILGIIFNIYWKFAWENDKKTNYRHRTEYYDTQTILCCFSFSIIMLNYNLYLSKQNNIIYL